MLISIVTIFPDFFAEVFDFGMIRQGRKKGLLETEIVDLRAFAPDERKTVDDRSYGGGEGMVLKPELIFEAVEKCQEKRGDKGRVILLSPQGRRFDQKKANELSLVPHMILICGRYEGVDQRVADYLADEELSVGDFVLSGGEFAACSVVDAVSRLIPGVVGKGNSVLEESFMDDLLDFPHYTRPAEFRGWKVPDILLSGDHVRIQRWRRQKAVERTQQKRPDLLKEESCLEDRVALKRTEV
ncbi:MAG: tRNA (guanosine(37)-N1)-methyltransferase TrmD [Acidobacteriota bacterium]